MGPVARSKKSVLPCTKFLRNPGIFNYMTVSHQPNVIDYSNHGDMDQTGNTTNETQTSELERLRARVAFLEQLKARQEPHNSEVLYKAIVSALPDLLFRIDRDGTYLEVGTANEHMLLLPRAQYKGKTLHDTIPPDVADLLLDRIHEALDTGAVQVVEFQLPTRTGPVEREGRIVAVGPDEVLLIVRDITGERRTEATLSRLSHQRELILEAAGEGIYGVDTQDIITFVNPAGARMLGYEVDELTGRPSHALIHHSRPDGTPYPWEECPLAATLREGVTHHADDEVFWRKDGTGFPVEHTSTTILEGGKIVGSVVTFRDISERKRAEEALAYDRSLLRTLIDHLPDIVYAKDTESRKLLANKADVRFMGAENPDDVIGKTDFDFYPYEQAARFYADDMQVIQSGEPVINREESFSVDGESHWLLTTKVPLRDSQGRVIGLVGIGHDVTDRLEAEEEVRKRASEMQAVAEVGTEVTSLQDPEQLLWNVANLTKERFGLYHTHIDLIDDTHKNLVLTASAGEVGRVLVDAGYRIPLSNLHSVAARAARERRAVIVNNAVATPDFLPNPLLPYTRSEMAIPLIVSNQVLGVLDVQSDQANRFTEEDTRVMTILASQIAVAVQNARQFEQTQSSQQLLRTLVDHLPDLVHAKDTESRYILANAAYARFLGLASPAEVVGKTIFDLYPRELAAQYYADDRAVLETGRPVEREELDVDHAGHRRWSWVTKVPLRDEQGMVVGLVGLARDITGRRQMEEALRKERDRAQQYLDLAGVMFVALDTDETVALINRRGCKTLGYKEEEIIGKNWFDQFLPEGVKDEVRGVFERLKTGDFEGIQYNENPILTQTGEERIIAWHNVLLTDETGRIIGTLSSGEDITARRQAEEALAAERNLLRTLIDNLPDHIYVKDTQGRFTIRNEAGARHMGAVSTDAVIGKTDFDYYPRELAEIYHAGEQLVIQSGQPVIDREEPIVDAEGNQGWILTTKIPLRDSLGRVIGLVGVGRDVTERKRTADALAHYAKRLDVLYSLEQSVLVGLSNQEVATEALQGFCQLVPCLSASMVLFDPAADTALIVTVGNYGEEVLDPGEEVPLDGFKQPDGSLRPQQAVITDLSRCDDPSPIYQKLLSQGIRACLTSPLVVEDTVLGMLVLGSDTVGAFGAAHRVITTQLSDQLAIAMSHNRLREQVERHNAELKWRVQERTAELERTRSRVEAILNNSSDAIILARPDSTISQVNLMFDQLFRYEPDELFHHPLTAIAHPTSAQVLQAGLQAVVQEGVIEHLEIVALRKDGSTFDAEVGLSLIQVAEEQLSGIVCNVHDITQRKQAEAELLKALETERELSELKTRFVSMASHEFRTPLTTIVSSTEILERYLDKMDPAQKGKHFARILTAAQHMTELLEEVLILGRINAGQLQCHPAPLDLKQMAQDALEQAQLTAGPNIEFAVSIGGVRPTVTLDEKLMRHILTNLLSNAVKYSPQGGKVHFHVDCGSDQTTIRVRDEGIGIPQKDLERLFEPFHRAENVDTIPGTGLGLAITKQAVELQGGSIAVESEVGVGTTFTITFPVTMLDEKGA
jgi:PAS domain S-box-containing protein